MKTDYARAFERLLIALEQELVNATDDEVLEAARDLGMNPTLKGSSALFGVTISAQPMFATEIADCQDMPPWQRRKGDLPPAD
ncbi:MAG: hypothetical protein GJU76_07335 [Gallionella sp.]|jgi:hypothetical protein|nr:hypothetical protein [Gallionella sp.]